MFTGVVEELGTVIEVGARGDGLRLVIAAKTVLSDVARGASIAVNGCCLTVVDHAPDSWATDVQPESLRCTDLGQLRVGDRVNLERPVRLTDRLDGHLVQGHVEVTGTIIDRCTEDGGSVRMRFAAPPSARRYMIGKGSVAVDGVSLTVASLDPGGFSVALIPHTLEVTTLGSKADGAAVNLEPDMIAKYVERLTRSVNEE